MASQRSDGRPSVDHNSKTSPGKVGGNSSSIQQPDVGHSNPASSVPPYDPKNGGNGYGMKNASQKMGDNLPIASEFSQKRSQIVKNTQSFDRNQARHSGLSNDPSWDLQTNGNNLTLESGPHHDPPRGAQPEGRPVKQQTDRPHSPPRSPQPQGSNSKNPNRPPEKEQLASSTWYSSSDPPVPEKRPRQSLAQLTSIYKDYKEEVWSRYPDVVDYVQALEHNIDALTLRCNGLQTEKTTLTSILEKIRASILSGIWQLHQRDEKEKFPSIPSDLEPALEFLLTHHEAKCKEARDQRAEIDRLTKERQDAIKENQRWRSYHERETARIIQEYEGRIRAQNESHKTRVDDLKTRHKERVDLLEAQENSLKLHHKEQLENQEALLKSEIDSLHASYATELHDQKTTYEHDMTVLQQALLTTVDRFQPLEDSMLQLRFRTLKNLVVRLSRTRFEVEGGTLGQAFDQNSFIQIAPKKHHRFVLESFIWATIVDRLFSTPFKVFGDQSSVFADTWSHMFQNNQTQSGGGFTWPEPDILSEKWRYTTFETLRRDLDQTNTNRHAASKQIMRSYQDNSSTVKNVLSAGVAKVTSEDKDADISSIVDEACSLALDFGIERCRLQLTAPQPNELVSMFNPGAYEDHNDRNDPSLTEGIVELVISPGLRKMGDGRGGRLDQVIDLCPAAIYMRAPSNGAPGPGYNW
ncbi:hypothetical protein K432DRAFT_403556 [Lepidopterella palustris CBS 459.81]|uniref:Uncharacterized protein n=1 Tax=Lepidopterella palustris CBS 459.81 TaxID=1314670 RepID=A0A8E2JGE5_9PEZI|nr:hypothetical protein K432DRAFT_403556 [Lepidopterella palustris CBS 459.81]